MTRHWTAPGVAGVVVALVTAWLVRAAWVLLAGAGAGTAARVGAVALVYAAGPAVLCAVPVVLLARFLLARAGRGIATYVTLGLVGGLLVGLVQTLVLLSAWPWQLAGQVAAELVGVPTVAGAVGGAVAGLVSWRRPPSDVRPERGG